MSEAATTSTLNQDALLHSGEPLYQVKLLSALRSGDPALIHPFLTEIGKDRRSSVDTTNGLDTGAAALHLAIRCGTAATVALLLSHRAISPNGVHPPGSGTTALHLAASLGRVDIVNLLLEQEMIDDSRRDAQGRTCKDVARNKEIVRAIEDSRSFLNASYRSLLRSYILSPVTETPPPALVALLESPRVQFINLSYLDDDSGSSLLHEAAARKDLRLIELAVRAGADVFVRNRRGKLAYEGTGKDDRVRVFLRQYANHDATLIQSPVTTSDPPTLRGYLYKYTNVAKGYNSRWFVLDHGVLSYYRHQEDETIASRGSISMRNAILKTSFNANAIGSNTNSPNPQGSGEKLRFEVHSTPPRGHGSSGIQKWYMKANHPVEAAKWIQALQRSIDWYKAGGGGSTPGLGIGGKGGLDEDHEMLGSAVGVSRKSGDSDISTMRGGAGTPSIRSYKHSLPGTLLMRKGKLGASTLGSGSGSGAEQEGSLSSSYADLAGAGAGGGRTSSDADKSVHVKDREDEPIGGAGSRGRPSSTRDDSSADSSTDPTPPHDTTMDLHGNSTAAQMELTSQLLSSFLSAVNSAPSSAYSSPRTNSNSPSSGTTSLSSNTTKLPTALQESFALVQSMLTEYTQMVKERDDWWKKQLARERERQNFWEESLASVVREGETLERELRTRSRKRGSKFFDAGQYSSYGSMSFMSASGSMEVPGSAPGSVAAKPAQKAPVRAQTVFEDAECAPSTADAADTAARSAPLAQFPQPSALPPKRPTASEADSVLPAITYNPPLTSAPLHLSPKPTPTTTPSFAVAAGPLTSSPTSTASTAVLPPKPLLPGHGHPHAHTLGLHGHNYSHTVRQIENIEEDEDEVDTDEEDEFFDAIETNNLPNLVIPQPLKSPAISVVEFGRVSSIGEEDVKGLGGEGVDMEDLKLALMLLGETQESFLDSAGPVKVNGLANGGVYGKLVLAGKGAVNVKVVKREVTPFLGYKRLRRDLGLGSDERPSTSLWSVLKHSIGKDLTKISFPVFFNEPTSMLQRMAEDMEFSECLDIAAREKDPLLRIAFVGAFAMSNYSSTIGRIAKPFNPMLSETFEYVRFDKGYAYLSEQVSHHPPISACWAQSPLWHYYGEVDAQNKFMGKSFEIRPTGVAHAELLLPAERAPNYPKAIGKHNEGKVIEHYTWKKVTTNVSGFILGSPTIDHYGDMVVTNHRTGDRCVLTFKPRGWRGKDAYEISGQVIDASGRLAYEIAGRWNSQLIARQVGKGYNGTLNPDATIDDEQQHRALTSSRPFASSLTAAEYILLWRNSDKVPGSPFNLTPFAVTLNDCPKDALKPYLCPTDCRLRPDQRAFEMGKYELANELKLMQEEKQRATRRAREEGKRVPHRPRWFRAETDVDTGERVWEPVRDEKTGALEYWTERYRVWKEGQGAQWKDVDPIFIDEPEEIRY
ncbi:hypothetical protein AX16_009471 [Volvariella volvacea WC 439]|nr:hypothetical protein AX16_009471 [Volvariella volvacea WC 439]